MKPTTRLPFSLARLAVGCEQLGGTDWGDVDITSVSEGVRAAWDAGVDTFDTASVYGLGRSEETLATVLGDARHSAIIATKCGYSWETSRDSRARTVLDGRPASIARSTHDSLRRLRLERLNLLQLHRPDPEVPIGESIGAMTELMDEGVVEAIGCSNVTPAQLLEACAAGPISTVQTAYSLLHRDAEQELLPLCARHGISVLAYGALGHGLLSGKYGASATFPPNDRRSRLSDFQGDQLIHNLDVARRVARVARSRDLSPVQIALAWVLVNPSITTVIAGIRSRAQLLENLEATTIALTVAECRHLEGHDDSRVDH